MLLEKERNEIVCHMQLMIERGLTKSTGGNISIFNREAGYVAISPSAVEYDELKAQDIAVLSLDGKQIDGNYEPSSETSMHLNCYKKRGDISSVVHTHSVYTTVLACMNEELPAVHYLIGYAGGTVKCIPYYPFGSKELAGAAANGLGDRNAVLLGNHGLVTVGKTVKEAFGVAEMTEFVAEIYYKTKCAGAPVLLGDTDMAEVFKRFKTYGKSKTVKNS